LATGGEIQLSKGGELPKSCYKLREKMVALQIPFSGPRSGVVQLVENTEKGEKKKGIGGQKESIALKIDSVALRISPFRR